MSESILFSPYQLGGLTLKNRVVMAPMTRSRAVGNLANELIARYYAQRAEAGLIVTEGTSPSPDGLGYPRIPGLFNAEQARAWRGVTEAVHRAGGRIFVQIMHTGRVGHPDNLPKGARVIGPSAVAAEGQLFVDGKGQVPLAQPEAMTETEIERAIEEYARSAELAVEAGFDGVELHGANGYLLEQFLNTASNRRTDAWGGSVENRLRFPLAVADRVAKRIGAQRVGIRVSPYGAANSMRSDDEAVEELHETLARRLSALGLVYLHVVDHSALGAPGPTPSLKRKLREAFQGTLILAGGYDRERAEADLLEKRADLIAFGRPFISNPKLVTRLEERQPLTPPDFSTFYTSGEKGYLDYPA